MPHDDPIDNFVCDFEQHGIVHAIRSINQREHLLDGTLVTRTLGFYAESAAYWPSIYTYLYNRALCDLIEDDIDLLLQMDSLLSYLKLEQMLITESELSVPESLSLWWQAKEEWRAHWNLLLESRPDLVACGLTANDLPWQPVGLEHAHSDGFFYTRQHLAQAILDPETFDTLIHGKCALTLWDCYPPAGDACYRSQREALFHMRAERYGLQHQPALFEYLRQQIWEDAHKGSQSYFPLTTKRWQKELDALEKHRQIFCFSKHTAPKHIIHVTSQIVDSAHAPTRLLDSLVVESRSFRSTVIVTERLRCRRNDFPLISSFSESSLERGSQTLARWRQKGIQVSLADTSMDYRQTAQWVAQQIEASQGDVAVFHGPDAIHTLATRQCCAQLRVLFDHGSLPDEQGGFDFFILSTEDALRKYPQNAIYLPFSYDPKIFWKEVVYPQSAFHVPEDAILLTTVSNSLSARLSTEFCHAIATILQRCPQAYYLPIGAIKDSSPFMAYFQSQGVEKRVKFLGLLNPAAQWMRTTHIYLNEFPFGSGLAILEAMAAGCPVVAMYDVNGPAQSRYGAQYMGIEHAASNFNAYVALACRLIEDAAFYQSLSQIALKRYEQHSAVTTYVAQFESAVMQKYLNLVAH